MRNPLNRYLYSGSRKKLSQNTFSFLLFFNKNNKPSINQEFQEISSAQTNTIPVQNKEFSSKSNSSSFCLNQHPVRFAKTKLKFSWDKKYSSVDFFSFSKINNICKILMHSKLF